MQEQFKNRAYINYNIRAPQVLCIDAAGNNIGVIPHAQAMELAKAAELDLVQVAPPGRDRPPTCKILDYGKYKYQESKKKKESDKKQRESAVKTHEIKFRPTTDINDLRIKAKKAAEFLQEGDLVKVGILFKGKRELSHKEIAMETLNAFLEQLPEAEMVNRVNFDTEKLMSVLLRQKN